MLMYVKLSTYLNLAKLKQRCSKTSGGGESGGLGWSRSEVCNRKRGRVAPSDRRTAGAAMSIADLWRWLRDGLGRAQKSCQSQCQFCQSTELIMKVMIDLYWFEPFIVSRSHSTMLKSQCSAGRQLLKRKRSGRDAQSSSQKLSEKPTAGTAVDRIVVAVWLMMVKIIKHEQTWCLVYVRIGVCSCPHIALVQLTETYIFPKSWKPKGG